MLRQVEAKALQQVGDVDRARWAKPSLIVILVRHTPKSRSLLGLAISHRAIRIARNLWVVDVNDVRSDFFILRGASGQIRFDNGPEFMAQTVRGLIGAVES